MCTEVRCMLNVILLRKKRSKISLLWHHVLYQCLYGGNASVTNWFSNKFILLRTYLLHESIVGFVCRPLWSIKEYSWSFTKENLVTRPLYIIITVSLSGGPFSLATQGLNRIVGRGRPAVRLLAWLIVICCVAMELFQLWLRWQIKTLESSPSILSWNYTCFPRALMTEYISVWENHIFPEIHILTFCYFLWCLFFLLPSYSFLQISCFTF